MQFDFSGKRILVTGASKGLGLAASEAFLRAGATVMMCSRNIKNLELATVDIRATYKSVILYAADATNYTDVKSSLQVVVKNMKGIDVLVNNVGSTEKFASFFDLTEDDWLHTFRANVVSIVNHVKIFHEVLKHSPAPRIINISSLTGLQPGIFSPHYSCCKAAVINLTKHLSNILSKDRILVNCIVPGPFKSDAWSRNINRVAEEMSLSHDEAEAREVEMVSRSIPLGRMGEAKDIEAMLLLLASDYCSWMSGSAIVIDGGKMRCMH